GGWAGVEAQICDVFEGDLCACGCGEENLANFLDRVAVIPRVSNAYWETASTIDDGGDGRSADSGFNGLVHVADGGAQTRKCRTIRCDIQVLSVRGAFSIEVFCPWDISKKPLCWDAQLAEYFEVTSHDF